MRRSSVGLVLVALLAAGLARADEKSHRRAAEELFKAMGTEKSLAASIDTTLDLQVKARPALARFKGVMKKFLHKHMSYDSLKADLVKMYTQEFTESEQKELTKFYQTPAGKKFARMMPVLMKKGAELGQRRVQENLDELKKMIEEAAKGNDPG
jgi:hypothetical protein